MYRMNPLLFRMDVEQEKRENWRRGPMPSPPDFQDWRAVTERSDPGTKIAWFKSQLRHLPAL